jgi:hypothetical protein
MKPRLAAELFAWAIGLLLLVAAADARADMCFGGGGRYDPPDAGKKDVTLETKNPGKRQLGYGLLAAASVGTAWLSFRRRDPNHRDG